MNSCVLLQRAPRVAWLQKSIRQCCSGRRRLAGRQGPIWRLGQRGRELGSREKRGEGRGRGREPLPWGCGLKSHDYHLTTHFLWQLSQHFLCPPKLAGSLFAKWDRINLLGNMVLIHETVVFVPLPLSTE